VVGYPHADRDADRLGRCLAHDPSPHFRAPEVAHESLRTTKLYAGDVITLDEIERILI
jgi:hypothetical protein